LCVRACCDHQQGGRRKLRGGLRLREEGAPAERATAREAGKFLKSEKNSALENNFHTEKASLGRNIFEIGKEQ
jgi:hypothetical protein